MSLEPKLYPLCHSKMYYYVSPATPSCKLLMKKQVIGRLGEANCWLSCWWVLFCKRPSCHNVFLWDLREEGEFNTRLHRQVWIWLDEDPAESSFHNAVSAALRKPVCSPLWDSRPPRASWLVDRDDVPCAVSLSHFSHCQGASFSHTNGSYACRLRSFERPAVVHLTRCHS